MDGWVDISEEDRGFEILRSSKLEGEEDATNRYITLTIDTINEGLDESKGRHYFSHFSLQVFAVQSAYSFAAGSSLARKPTR